MWPWLHFQGHLSTFIPYWILTTTQSGARGQNLGHLFKSVFLRQTVGRTLVSLLTLHWLMGHEAKVTMTYISRSSDFALDLENYLMYEHHTLGLYVSMTMFDLYFMVHWFCLIHVSWRLFKWCMNIILHCDLYFMVQWFCLISWKLFNTWISYSGTMSQYDPTSDLKIFIGHCDLYFMVQWFCLCCYWPANTPTSL